MACVSGPLHLLSQNPSVGGTCGAGRGENERQWVCRSYLNRKLRTGAVHASWNSLCTSFLPRHADAARLKQCQVAPQSCVPTLASPKALFTGIVEEMGEVESLVQVEGGGWELTVKASETLGGVKLGDSIAVNGTCLTVTSFDSSSFKVGLAPETLRKTCLGEVVVGSPVNLERSLLPDTRMGGHFVQGHVDGTGTIAELREEGDSLWVTIKTSPDLLRYIVPKGYIAVDGTSLTVVEVLDHIDSFTFMLVAYTQQKIVVPRKQLGNKVNLEVDIVGKYVERMMQGYKIKAFAETVEKSSSGGEGGREGVEVSKVGDYGSLQ